MEETSIHVGELIQKVQKESGMQVTKLSEKVGYALRTVYQHYEKATLPADVIAKYGHALKHDFSKDIPEMSAFISAESINLVRNDQSEYGNAGLNEVLADRDKWKTLAYTHLEEAKAKTEEAAKWQEKYYDLLLSRHNIKESA